MTADRGSGLARDPEARPLRTLIVDDEALARRGLEIRLAQLPGVEIVGECANGREAVAMIGAQAPDLVFLDIEMPGLDGFDVIREVQADSLPMIVFVTAFDQYALHAFDVHAVDYVLKPVELARLTTAVERARARRDGERAVDEKAKLLDLIGALERRPHRSGAIEEPAPRANGPRISFKDGATIVRVPVADIDWIDAAGDYMCIHAEGKTHVVRMTMKALEGELDPARFQRIHRSTIVNLDRVERLSPHTNGEYFVSLVGGAKLKLSRTYKEKLARFL